MARTAITVRNLSTSQARRYMLIGAGGDYAAEAADSANGMNVVNNGRTRLYVKNGGVGAITVTINSVADPGTGRTGNLAPSVPAGEDCWFGPLEPSLFNQSDGTVNVDFSGATSVTVIAISD